jgi:hypothetical protein
MKLQETRRFQLLSLFIALVIPLTMYPIKALAQIYGSLEVDIPFQFYVVNTKLPSGRYIVRMLDNSDMGAMEITSADGSVSVFFEVGAVKADSSRAKSELIFSKYGNRYFLEKLFDEGGLSARLLAESGYEKRIGQAAAEAQEHVPAHHREN